MPPMIQRKDLSKILYAFETQKRTGRPSLRLSNRCVVGIGLPSSDEPLNRNIQLKPKPMTQENVAAVRKETGFTPFLETKFVRV